MKKNTLTFVTKNKEKIADIKTMLGKSFQLEFDTTLELLEIQTLSVEEVVAFKAIQAYKQLKRPVVVSDSGLEIVALRNFPGALVKFVNETIGQKGLVKLLEGEEDRRAFFVAAIAFCAEECSPHIFVEKDEGTIAEKPRGEGWYFDRIFIPKGEKRTWAEMGREKKNTRSAFRRALDRLAAFLQEQYTAP